jgi:glycosyltransferase involved in cell wall biosynthesis
LAGIIERVDPAVVVLHSAKAGLVGRLVLRSSRPTVYLPHAWSFLALSAKLAPAALNWERQAARWTNAVIAVSDAEAELTVQRGIHVPLFVVRNPVPPGWPQVDAADRAAARSALGLGDAPLAVSVGRLSRQKGHDVLIEAWPRVLRRVPQAQLVIVGDGELRQQLAGLGTPGVTFVGAMPDPRPWVSAADLVVLPSRWEGMSLAMLEALSAGRSVVTTDVAGSEVVTRSQAGAVVPVEDPIRLADALAERLSGQVDADAEGRLGADHARLEHDRNRSLGRASAVVSRAHAFGRLRDVE